MWLVNEVDKITISCIILFVSRLKQKLKVRSKQMTDIGYEFTATNDASILKIDSILRQL
jgi:hypothetical protein